MLDPGSVLDGAIPTVDPADLQRFCSFHWQQAAPSETGYTAYALEAIQQLYQSGSADPMAIWARASLLIALWEEGSLEHWREDHSLQQTVFQAAAVFPMPHGLQALDSEEFIATLPAYPSDQNQN